MRTVSGRGAHPRLRSCALLQWHERVRVGRAGLGCRARGSLREGLPRPGWAGLRRPLPGPHPCPGTRAGPASASSGTRNRRFPGLRWWRGEAGRGIRVRFQWGEKSPGEVSPEVELRRHRVLQEEFTADLRASGSGMPCTSRPPK